MKRLSIILITLLMIVFTTSGALASDKYDLSNFGWRYVDSKGRGSLVFQKAPRGKSMKGHKFYTGDKIFVNLNYRKDGYGIAYEDGEYGYVDASYINWGSSSSSGSSSTNSSGSSSGGMSSSDKNLSNFEYRRVASNGRGSLVFQKAPRGKSMKGHKFYDGDWIYVNVNYRKDGYSIAYENGEYGYVDASYIDWGSGDKGSNDYSYGDNTGGSGSVSFSGNVNVRTGPGLDYATLGSVNKGQRLSYAGETKYDNRGIAWYYVYYNGNNGWVSSKYASLKDASSGSSSGSQETPVRGSAIELSGYYDKDVNILINDLGGGFTVTHYEFEDGSNVSYKKNGLEIDCYDTDITIIYIQGVTKYSLHGVTVGMSQSDAQAILKRYPYNDNWGGYVIRGTKNEFELLLGVEYDNGRVKSVYYGIWS